MRPVIGITCNYSFDNASHFAAGIAARGQEWQLLADDYVSAIERAGAIPVIIPFYQDLETSYELLEHLDGIVFSGGNDIDPTMYGEHPVAELGEIIPLRDRQDIELCKKVIKETNLPVLGVCRGIQVLNVALGGTNHQHLPAAGYESHSLGMFHRYAPSHDVNVVAGSRLHKVLGDVAHVNSFHHQAVKDVAPGLKVVATAPSGLVEAVELDDDNRFVLATQWHPEMMAAHHEEFHKLLESFVQACVK